MDNPDQPVEAIPIPLSGFTEEVVEDDILFRGRGSKLEHVTEGPGDGRTWREFMAEARRKGRIDFDKGGEVTVTRLAHEIPANELHGTAQTLIKKLDGWQMVASRSETHTAPTLWAASTKAGVEKPHGKGEAKTESFTTTHHWLSAISPDRKLYIKHAHWTSKDDVKWTFAGAMLSGHFFVKVGTMTDYALGLTEVLADGRVVTKGELKEAITNG